MEKSVVHDHVTATPKATVVDLVLHVLRDARLTSGLVLAHPVRFPHEKAGASELHHVVDCSSKA